MLAVLVVNVALLANESAQNAYQNGVALFQAGKFADAVKALTTATALEPKNAQAWKALGVAYAAQSQFDLAEQPFTKACQLNPKLRDACYYLGRNRYAINRFETSLEALKIALKYDDRPWRIHLSIAQDLEALGRPEEAEAQFQKSIKLNEAAPVQIRMRPDEDPRIAYGIFLFRAGRTEQALAPLTSASTEYPDCAKARMELGRSLYQLGRAQDALPHLERAVALDPNSTVAHLLLGKVLLLLDRSAEAQSHLERARSLGPEP